MREDGDDPPLRDLIDDRSDIAELRPLLKDRAKEARARGDDVSVDDMLAMTRNNDAAYVQPSDLEKAEWFAEIWKAEGRPDIHPRGMHYRIFGKDYTLRDGTEYTNTQRCWEELKDGAKWAQILGLVDADAIENKNSQTPRATGVDDLDDPAPDPDVTVANAAAALNVSVDTGYRGPRVRVRLRSPSLRYDDAGELTEAQVDRLVERAFNAAELHATAEQDYYIELWAEKSGVLDDSLASEYDATIREAGGGEFGYEMCRDAVRVADERGQGLVVGIISDYDPKGLDMPKSAARKLELEGALANVDVHVHHAAVTRDQLAENPAPRMPAKEPRGLMDRNPGAIAYERQKDYFEDYARGDPVEINSFKARHPDAYEDAIRDVLDHYYDHELDDRLETALQQAREETRNQLLEAYDPIQDDLSQAVDDLRDAFEEFDARLQDEREALEAALEEYREAAGLVEDELYITEKVEELRELINDVDAESVLEDATVETPTPRVEPSESALLDTRRGFFEQLEEYQSFDVRYQE